MTKEAILTAIRRGLRRGALPEDQIAMLRGRLERHPRQLIPARSRLSHPKQIDLFISNVEKEFGSVTRVADDSEVPGAVADYLALMILSQTKAFDTCEKMETKKPNKADIIAINHVGTDGRFKACTICSSCGV